MVLSSLSNRDLRGHCRCLAKGRLAVSAGERSLQFRILGCGDTSVLGRCRLPKHPRSHFYGDHYSELPSSSCFCSSSVCSSTHGLSCAQRPAPFCRSLLLLSYCAVPSGYSSLVPTMLLSVEWPSCNAQPDFITNETAPFGGLLCIECDRCRDVTESKSSNCCAINRVIDRFRRERITLLCGTLNLIFA